MAARKRIVKKRPEFRATKSPEEQGEDLKAVKAKILKELEDDEKNKNEWYDNELDKNLKKQ